MQDGRQRVICNCPDLCKGGAYVSARTWYDHRKYRLPSQQAGRVPASASKRARQDDNAVSSPNLLTVPSIQRHDLHDVPEGDCMSFNEVIPNTGQSPAPVQDSLVSDTGGTPLDHGQPAEAEEEYIDVKREDVRITLEYIRLIREASLDNSGLDPDLLEQLRNPPELELTIDDPNVILSIEIYLAVGNASIETYNAVRDALKHRSQDMEILSFYRVSSCDPIPAS
ncbi:hypothetical protein C8Q77DRAFT_1059157 [Trametes polyzona]|nr:hypothetical protein C8Q77DRAFT_1059157 [Trametes polyzona]